jgi:hypothetical protein
MLCNVQQNAFHPPSNKKGILIIWHFQDCCPEIKNFAFNQEKA